MEDPQLKECYLNNKSLCHKKPRKVIITEIYDEFIPKNKNHRKSQKYFNYYTRSSLPNNYERRFSNISQNKLFSKNQYCLTERESENYNCYTDNRKLSDYNKQLYFGRTDLREEFSPTSNERIDIRKKVYRGGTPPHPYRNSYNLETDDKFVENFQYYESKNIKDKNNKKYESITRVTGYSNLIPMRKRKMPHNYTTLNIHRNVEHFNNQIPSRYENYEELQHNLSNIDIYKNNILNYFKNRSIQPKKHKSEENITTVQLKKTSEIYENKRKNQLKPEIIPKNTNIQTITKKTNIQKTTKTANTQNVPKTTIKQTSLTKYETKKPQPKEKKITNVYVQKKTETKYEIIKKPQTTSKATNVSKVSSVQKANATKKFETFKNVQNTSKTTNVSNLSSVQNKSFTKKYETFKNLKKITKKSATNTTSQKNNDKNLQKNYSKLKIDTSKYINPKSEKLYFKRSHGRYSYKESLSAKDILNSRCNKNANTNKVEIIEHNSKTKEKRNSISNIKNKSNISSIANKITAYKKIENTSKTLLNNKSTSKINNNSKATSTSKITNTSNIKDAFINRSNRRTKESATLTKKIMNITSNISNKGVNNNYIKKSMTGTNSTTNVKNINLNKDKNKQKTSNYTSKDYNIKKTQIETYNKYKKEYINNSNADNHKKDISHNQYLKTNENKETQTINMTNQYNNNVKKLRDDRNDKYIANTEIDEIYEMERSGKRETTPKLRIKILGDNYKYYEGKYIPNPYDITSSYTLHQRRNQRVIYGTEEIDGSKAKNFFNSKPNLNGYRTIRKKIVKRRVMPLQGAPNQYIDYPDYYEGNYHQCRDSEYNEYNDYENDIGQTQFYYQ
jgi:hypothetical protein